MNHPVEVGAEITLGRFQTVYGTTTAWGGQRQIQTPAGTAWLGVDRLGGFQLGILGRSGLFIPRARVLTKWL